MTETLLVEIGLALFSLFTGVLGWLLVNKDSKQGESITDLYTKLKELGDKHTAFELRIAHDHMNKNDIRNMFSDLKDHFDEKFAEMKVSINEVNNRRAGQ